ncbi:MAG: glycosyltransferase [Patescibacteria group bacterium]
MTAQEKLKILQKVLKEGASVSSVCRKFKISRKTFYAWKKRYLAVGPRGKITCLEKRHLRGLQHPRGLRLRFKKDILRLVTLHPEWGSHTLNKKLKIKNKILGNHGVYSLLKELGLETYLKRKEFAGDYRSPLRLLPEARKRMVERVILAQEKVGEVAGEFVVSRKTLWKWAKRYKEGQEMQDQNPTGSSHPRGTPEWLEKKILEAIVRNPEYSTHKLAQIIPKIGNHGIQNVLLRNGLNTFDRRLVYARTHAPVSLVQPITGWLNRLKSVWQTFVPTIAPAPPPKIFQIFRRASPPFLLSFLTSSILSFLFLLWLSMISSYPAFLRPGLFFASISLLVGSFFFLYSMKYYFTLALVLSFSTQTSEVGPASVDTSARQGWLARIFGIGNGALRGLTSLKSSTEVRPPLGGGLQPNLEHIKLERYPFISVHLPFYNEKKVAERILSACTSFDYPHYEVIVCDDSTDETVEIINEWKDHPRVKILHRPTREGFKGGALREALKHLDPKTEFVIIFDADFIPYPDTLEMFVKYFKATGGWNEQQSYQATRLSSMPYDTFSKVEISTSTSSVLEKQVEELRKKNNIACVAGYQWHVLNKSENWITRGVRTEYAGSYVIERPGQEILGALKIIHGSVYCIRADVLKHFGWGTSITEDFELTLRIYEKGFKVVYTPYVQAPSECVSTIKRLIRQRMRWAEGHSFNVRKMFLRLLFGKWETVKTEDRGRTTDTEDREQKTEHQPSVIGFQNPSSAFSLPSSRRWVPSKLTFAEKLEFLYLSPYYLQAFFFLIGTFSWLISETVFPARLPFWTSLWGWSLVLTNFFALPLVNAVGLFLEESEERDYLGILSFVALSYLLVPFQAYAAVKGFLESQEGPWFRTPKTGKITDIFTRGRFYRWITGILPGRAKPSLAPIAADISADQRGFFNQPLSAYVALATANNHFNRFHIKPKKMRWLAKTFLAVLLILSLNLSWLSFKVPLAHASPGTQIKTIEMPIYQYAANADDTDIAASNGIDNTAYTNNGPQFSLNIPETMVDCRTDLTGTNPCYAYVEWRTILSVANVTSGEMKFRIGTSAFKTLSLTTLNTNSGESQSLIIRMDVTSEVAQGNNTYNFNANVDVARNTDSAKLIVTYEYDDSATTQVKTVRYALPTKESQSAANTNDTLTSTLNPNLQEANISIQKAWIELTGQVSAGTADTGTRAIIQDSNVYPVGSGATNLTMMDGDNKTTMDFVAMYEPSNVVASGAGPMELNYNAANTIAMRNAGQVMNLKGGELLITYNYSYYNTSSTTHRNAVRYYVGQLDGALPTSYTQIGAPVVYLPESSLANYNVYLKVVGTNVDNTGTRYRVTITGGSAVEYPSATTYYAAAISEQAGREVIFIDISSNFSSNWSSGDTVTVEAIAEAASDHYAIGAELVISYNFTIPVGSGTFTNIKTVNWFIGQQTAKAADNWSPTFNTYIPETSTTVRSSGGEGNYVISDTGNWYKGLQVASVGNDSSYTTTGENVTLSNFSSTGLTGSSQTSVSAIIRVSDGSSAWKDSLKGGITFTTYEVSAPQAPEKALMLLFVAPFLPKIVEWWRRKYLQ